MTENDGVSTPWRKSSYCANGSCVEIAATDRGVMLRDSKDLSKPPLSFDRAAWLDFVHSVKAGEFASL